MIIGKRDKEYVERLEDDLRTANQQINDLKVYQAELEKQNRQLSQLISLKAEDRTNCKVGPWCEGCAHRRTNFTKFFYSHKKGKSYCNAVSYCAKHIHELCPEWEPENHPGQKVERIMSID